MERKLLIAPLARAPAGAGDRPRAGCLAALSVFLPAGLSVFLAAGLGGCLRTTSFACERDDQCTGSTAGRCELVGFCSFPDDECASGSRFAEHAGSYSGQCVGAGPDIDAPRGCPSTYAPLTGAGTHVYRLLTALTAWPIHQTTCTTEGGYLVEPDDAAELAAVVALAGETWVGVTDQSTEATFVTGRGVPIAYLPWELGEPDDGPQPGGDCVRSAPGGTYADDRCGASYRAVCECEP